jgi:hypothetical protein
MKNITFILTIILIGCSAVSAQRKTAFPDHVTIVQSESNKTVTVESKLEDGRALDDLSWAWSSSNACFPGTQAQKFGGNHVFFATTIPTRSIMTVKVIPEDTGANFSLYAYSIGMSDFYVVPELPRCVTCEADHKWDRPWKGKTQDHTRWVELNAIGNPFNVVIGVTAPKGVVSGKFRLEIAVKS